MIRICLLLAGLMVLLTSVGCSKGAKEEDIEVKASNDPLNEPRSVLKRYAAGQAMGSEVSSFPHMVENVRKVDTARADILQKGFEDLQKASPSARAAKAKELLSKLQPSMK
jgi:O-phosphoseryl-tRNA(Cys) synthetase